MAKLSNSLHDAPVKNNSDGLEKETNAEYPLCRNNFIWMVISGVIIIMGFLLMLGGGSTDEFNPDIFSIRRIVIGPSLAFIGFVAMGIAIIVRPRESRK